MVIDLPKLIENETNTPNCPDFNYELLGFAELFTVNPDYHDR